MQFKIHFDQEINQSLYNDYCEFLFEEIKKSVKRLINPLKYRARESLVLKSSVIKWTSKKPKSINLSSYVENCLEMVRVKGEFVVRIRDDQVVSGSKTKVKTLVRLLEYGNESVPAYPVLRRVLLFYSKVYKDLIVEFIRERMLQ